MIYLYDTDSLIDYLSGYRGARARFQTFLRDGIALSIVTVNELSTGAYGGRDPTTTATLRSRNRSILELISNHPLLMTGRTVTLDERLKPGQG